VTHQEEFRAPKYGRNGIKAQVLIFSLEKVLRSMAERSGLLSMGVETISGPESTGLAGAGIDIILEGGDTGRKMEWVVYETYDVEDENSSKENPELLDGGARQDSGDGHDGADAAYNGAGQGSETDDRAGLRQERSVVQRFELKDAIAAAQLAVLQATKRRTEMAVFEVAEEIDSLGRLLAAFSRT
jgi:hypothetical protein